MHVDSIEGQSLGRTASRNGQNMDSIDSSVTQLDSESQLRNFDTPAHSFH
jgi:hypothetical protein